MMCAYIYIVLVMNKNGFKDHLNALDKVLLRLDETVLNLNVEK